MLFVFIGSVSAFDGDFNQDAGDVFGMGDKISSVDVGSEDIVADTGEDDVKADSLYSSLGSDEGNVLNADSVDPSLGSNEYHVSGTSFSDIQSVIDSSSDGDIIFLDNQSFMGTGTSINITKQLTIYGGSFIGDSSQSTFGAQGLSSIFNVSASNVVLNNINFIYAWSTSNGSAVYWSGVNGSIVNCSFVNCSSHSVRLSTAGGAVFWEGVNGSIVNCSFVNCSADFFGGAVYWSGVNGSVVDCSFVNSSSYMGGSAVYWSGVNGSMVECSFVNCSSSDGGAVVWSAVNGSMVECSFVNCSSYRSGGAVYWLGVNGSVVDCSFVNNSADNGSAIYSVSGDTCISGCLFVNNIYRVAYVIYPENLSFVGRYFDNAVITNVSAGERTGLWIDLTDSFGVGLNKTLFLSVSRVLDGSIVFEDTVLTVDGLFEDSFMLPAGDYVLGLACDGDEIYDPLNVSYEFSVSMVEVDLILSNESVLRGDSIVATLVLPGDAAGTVTYFVNGSQIGDAVSAGEGMVYEANRTGLFNVSAVYSGDDYGVCAGSAILEVLPRVIVVDGNSAADIQRAIDELAPGDVLDLGENVVYENVSDVNITKSLTLIGSNVTIMGEGVVFNVLSFGDGVEDVVIRDLIFVPTVDDTVLFSAVSVNDVYGVSIIGGIGLYGLDVSPGVGVNPSSISILSVVNDGVVFNPLNDIVVTGNSFVSGVKPFVLVNNWTDDDDVVIPAADVVQSRILITDIASGLGYVRGVLLDGADNPIAGALLNVSVNGEFVSVLTGLDGVFVVSDLIGDNEVLIAYSGGDKYSSCDVELELKNSLVKRGTDFVFSNMTTNCVVESRTGKYFNVVLVDSDGFALAGKNVMIGFNGKVYERTTNATGGFRLQVNLANAGGYTFAISFLGDDEFDAAFGVAKITVVKNDASLSVSPVSISKSKATDVKLTFKLANGTAVVGKTVYFKVNGKTYSAKTGSNGVATVRVSISVKGSYSYSAWYDGDAQINKVTRTGKITVK